MKEVEITDASGQVIRCFDIDGYNVPMSYLPLEIVKDIVLTLPDFKCRTDDVLLCTFPKTGTNWVFEIMMMLLSGSSKRVEINKVQTMFELMTSDMIDDQPSPRILNTHLSSRFLPKDLVTKQVKTVLVVRNPKDTVVSFFHHMTGINKYKYKGQWTDWFPLYTHGKLEYGKYTTYLREWESLIKTGLKFPLHIVYYENLHKNCFQEVKRLAEFLHVTVSDNLIQDIVNMCGFDKMAQEKFNPEVKKVLFQDHFHFFRKGKVGDWKNWFTLKQNKEFDALWNKEMEGSSYFKFVYDDRELRSKL